MVHLLHSGRCYEAEICVIVFLLRCPFTRYPRLSKSFSSVLGQNTPWTITVRHFDQVLYASINSSLEGATELKCSRLYHMLPDHMFPDHTWVSIT